MSRPAFAELVLVLWVAAGCGGNGPCLSFNGCGGTANDVPRPILIDANGGTVVFMPERSSAWIKIEVPPGALLQPVEIRARTVDGAAPAGALSAFCEFTPEETTFAVPARFSMSLLAGTGWIPDSAHPTIYWSNASGGFDPLTSTVDPGSTYVSASITHLGRGYIGSGTQ